MHPIRNKFDPYDDSDGYFWARYSSVNPRMALFIKVTPTTIWGGSANAVGFTSCSRNMELPGHAGVVFKSSPGISGTQLELMLDSPSNVELMGIFNSDSFTEEDVLAGKWNFAELEMFVACWDDPALGEWMPHKGNLGEMTTMQRYFKAESRGPLSRLSQERSVVTSRQCRQRVFGPAPDGCGRAIDTVVIGVTTYNMEHTLTVASVTNNYTIVFTKLSGTANNVPDDFFSSGKITAIGSTANGGCSREIRSSETDTTITIVLKRRFPFPISPGSQFVVQAGCDRTLERCVLYGNAINRQAEDFIPTIEAMNRVPNA